MTYKANVAVCSEILQNPQCKEGTMQNFWMLNLMVRKEIPRLLKVNTKNSVTLSQVQLRQKKRIYNGIFSKLK